jgi:hypothetical protein
MDKWLFLRDMIWYLIGLALVILFLFLGTVTWWMAIILIVYYGIFFIIQIKNDEIKNKIYRLVGITHEDDSFNADE